MKTTRRGFLGALTSVIACAPLGAFAAASESATLAFKLAVMIPNAGAAAKLGRAYTQKFPDEAHVDTLTDLICGSSTAVKQQIIDAYPGIRRQVLKDMVKKDFESAQTVEVEGWILSRTEARLFALASLTTPPAAP